MPLEPVPRPQPGAHGPWSPTASRAIWTYGGLPRADPAQALPGAKCRETPPSPTAPGEPNPTAGNAHAAAACTGCHTDEKGMKRAHRKASAEKAVDATKLKKSKVEVGACTGCHDGTALELPAAADLADSHGNKADPHALPDGEGHSSITCVSCHKLHDAEEKVEETAYDLCYGCHHDEVFECGTCH